jgi:UDP-glucose 4-epimerase
MAKPINWICDRYYSIRKYEYVVVQRTSQYENICLFSIELLYFRNSNILEIIDNNMNIIVTGGVGFVGTNLVKRLKEDGHKVIVIDDYSVGKVENQIEGVRYLPMNVEQIDYINGEEVDLCFHLAALSRIQPSFQSPSNFFRVNVSGTEAVCEWARKWNVKVVYAGSSSQWHNPFLSPYALYKKLGEDICKLYRQTYGTDIEIARFYNVYGPYEITEGEWAAVIGKWRGQVAQNYPITIVGDGEQRRDFTHIEDIVDGLIKIAFSDEKHEDAWELGTGFNYSLNEVADMFVEKFNCTKINTFEQSGNYRETIRVNDDAINRLGWQPKDILKDYIKNL